LLLDQQQQPLTETCPGLCRWPVGQPPRTGRSTVGAAAAQLLAGLGGYVSRLAIAPAAACRVHVAPDPEMLVFLVTATTVLAAATTAAKTATRTATRVAADAIRGMTARVHTGVANGHRCCLAADVLLTGRGRARCRARGRR
jgi:hypothetical protein